MLKCTHANMLYVFIRGYIYIYTHIFLYILISLSAIYLCTCICFYLTHVVCMCVCVHLTLWHLFLWFNPYLFFTCLSSDFHEGTTVNHGFRRWSISYFLFPFNFQVSSCRRISRPGWTCQALQGCFILPAAVVAASVFPFLLFAPP